MMNAKKTKTIFVVAASLWLAACFAYAGQRIVRRATEIRKYVPALTFQGDLVSTGGGIFLAVEFDPPVQWVQVNVTGSGEICCFTLGGQQVCDETIDAVLRVVGVTVSQGLKIRRCEMTGGADGATFTNLISGD